MNDEPRGLRPPGTLSEMRDRCLHWREDARGRRVISGSAYNRYILRPLSVRLTRTLVGLGVRADTVTVIMILMGGGAIVCGVPHVPWATAGAALGFFGFDLLDAVDGEIARWQGTSSTRGLFLDKVAHLMIEYPSLGLAAFHGYVVTSRPSFLMLGGVAVVSGLMGRTLRETFSRINAEAGASAPIAPAADPDHPAVTAGWFLRFCRFVRRHPLLAFPVTKARVVHLLSLAAISSSYAGSLWPLVCLAWFYAIYGGLRLVLEIPFFYWWRVVDAPHHKADDDYRWPI